MNERNVIEKRVCHNCGHEGVTKAAYREMNGRRVSEGYVKCPSCGKRRFAIAGNVK